MNYYERHLGDYARDTAHLSMVEHGAYTLLLDRYYATETEIPADQAHRLARARSKEERAAVDAVLSEFFELTEKGWRHGRVEKEIVSARVRIDAAKKNGTKGGRPKKSVTSETQEKPSGFSLGSENETQPKALQAPGSNLQEEAESKAFGNGQAVAPPADPIPINPAAERQALRLAVVTRDAVETFNAVMSVQGCGLLSAVLLPDSDTRRSNVRRSLKVVRAICEKLYGKPEITREFWKTYWDECANDPFKSGRGPYGNGHENWKPDFEYLTRAEVIEKTYNDSASQAA